jgi:hypothetical protein
LHRQFAGVESEAETAPSFQALVAAQLDLGRPQVEPSSSISEASCFCFWPVPGRAPHADVLLRDLLLEVVDGQADRLASQFEQQLAGATTARLDQHARHARPRRGDDLAPRAPARRRRPR